MTKREEIFEFLKLNKELFLSKYGIRKIGVFGSYAKQCESRTSDLDLLIEMDPSKKNLHSFLEFKRYLERELGMKVDVGLENALKPVVRGHIEREIVYV